MTQEVQFKSLYEKGYIKGKSDLLVLTAEQFNGWSYIGNARTCLFGYANKETMSTVEVKKWRPVKNKSYFTLNLLTINCAQAIRTSNSDLSGLDLQCSVKILMWALVSLAVRCFC